MREQRHVMIATMTDRMGLDAEAIRNWTTVTDRLVVELSNVARTLEWQ
jgi:hypothetical protein